MARNLLKALRPRWSSQGQTIRRPRLRLEVLEDRVTPAISSAHFAVIGDYGTGEQPEQDVANLVHSWNPDFVATTCDNNYSTPPMTTTSYDIMVGKYYHDFIYPYSGSYGAGATSNRFWPTMGDHDWGYDRNGDQAYLSFFKGLPSNRRYYTVTQGPVALFILDTYQSEPDGTSSISTQAQWLQGALASSTAPWKLVFLSEPPYSSGPFGSIGGVEWPFQAWGASAVFSGHDHGYERLFENGIPYFVNGSGGAGLDSPPASVIAGSQAHANVYGAMKVDASAAQISFSFSDTSGTVLDTYALNYVLPAAPNSLTATAVSS